MGGAPWTGEYAHRACTVRRSIAGVHAGVLDAAAIDNTNACIDRWLCAADFRRPGVLLGPVVHVCVHPWAHSRRVLARVDWASTHVSLSRRTRARATTRHYRGTLWMIWRVPARAHVLTSSGLLSTAAVCCCRLPPLSLLLLTRRPAAARHAHACRPRARLIPRPRAQRAQPCRPRVHAARAHEVESSAHQPKA